MLQDKRNSQIQILYDIGTSMVAKDNLEVMLNSTLLILIKKLNCFSGGIYFCKEEENKLVFEMQNSVPKNISNNETLKFVLQHLSVINNNNKSSFFKQLPIVIKYKNNIACSIISIGDLGFVVLFSKSEPLESFMINSLQQMLFSLSNSCKIVIKTNQLEKSQAELKASVQSSRFYHNSLNNIIKDLKISQQKLKNSEETFKAISTSAYDGIIMIDTNGSISFWNKAAEKIFDYTIDEILGRNLHDLLSGKEDNKLHKARFPEFINTGKGNAVGKTLELIALKKGGEEINIELSFSALQINNQWHAVGIVRDITKRKQEQEKLIASERLWSFALEGSGDGVWDWNPLTNEVSFPHQLKKLLGYNNNEIENKFEEWEKRIHPDDKEQVYTDLNKHLKGETDVFISELRLKAKNGNYIWILERGLVVERDNDQKPLRVIGTISDISGRKKIEASIKQERKNFQTFFNTIRDFVFILDLEANIIQCNKVVYDQLAYSENDLIGKSILFVHPEDKRKEAGRIVKEMLMGKLEYYTISLQTKSGKLIPVETRVINGKWNGKDVLIGISKNITQITKVLNELKHSQLRFKALSDAPSQAIFFSDKGICTDQNLPAEQMFGYTMQEAVGNPGTDWIIPEDRDLVMKKMIQGYELPYEATALRKDGTTFPALIQGKIIQAEEKSIRVTILQDISLLKEKEIKISEQKQKLQIITDSILDIIFLLNKTGKIIYISSSVNKITGYKAEEVIGMSFTKFAPKTEWNRYFKVLKQIFLNNEIRGFETYLLHKNGHVIPVEINGQIIKQKGKLIAHGVIRDISERREKEKLLNNYSIKLEQDIKERTTLLKNEIHEREKIQQIIQQKLEFERLTSAISSNFASNISMANAIKSSLAIIGEFSDADRAYVFKFDKSGLKMNNTYEWCAPGINPEIDNLVDLPIDLFPWWIKKLENKELIYIPNVSKLPTEAKAEKEILESQNINSALVLPIFINEHLQGFVGFDNVEKLNSYDFSNVNLLYIIAEKLSNAIEYEEILEGLYNSEQRYRSLVENSNAGVCITNKNEILTFVNNAFANIAGYAQDELTGMHLSVLTTNEGIKDFVSRTKNRRLKGLSDSYDSVIKKKNGEIANILVSASPISDKRGVFIATATVIIDITEQKRSQILLKQSETELIAINMQLSKSEVTVKNNLKDQQFLYNILKIENKQEASLEMLFQEIVDLIPSGIGDLNNIAACIIVFGKHYKTKNWANSSIKHTLKFNSGNDTIGTIEIIFVKKSDKKPEYRFTKSQIFLLEILSNRLSKIIKHRRFLLENQKLSIAIKNSPVGIMITDKNSKIEYTNPAITTITGYTSEYLINQKSSILKSGFQSNDFYADLWNTIKSGDIWKGELYNKKKNGELYWENSSISSIKDNDGQITHYISIKEDITLDKKSYDDMKKIELKMFSQSKLASLGEVATGIAHEINQPLTYINTVIQTLLEEIEDEDIDFKLLNTRLKNSGEQVNRITKIINHLRMYGRQDELINETIDFSEVLDNALLIISERLRLNNINLKIEIDQDINLLYGNPLQIEQVFLNFFTNAIDAFDEDKNNRNIVIHISADKTKIIVEFSDNGKGIPNTIREKIFEPFFTTKKVGKGTGLGLSIIYGIIKQHNGEITCTSNVGEGTKFTIVFSLSKTE